MKFFTRLSESLRTSVRLKFLRLNQILGRPRDFEEQVYKGLIQKGDIVFDVGANLGSVSFLLARLVGPTGKVFAFEPLWPVYEMFCSWLPHHKRANCASIIPILFGLSDSVGTQTIQVPGGKWGSGSLASKGAWGGVQETSDIGPYECSFVTLDAFIRARGLEHPAFMKIDVEGAELLVLRGATMRLRSEQPPLMLIELFAPWEKAFCYGPWDVLSLLSLHGYRFLFMCPEGLVDHAPSSDNPFPQAYRNGYNIIAYVPKAHSGRVHRLELLRAGQNAKILPMRDLPRPNIIT